MKIQERELSWLTNCQIAELLDSICSGCDNPHVEPVVLICLATDARWSEAEKLKPTSARNGSSRSAGQKAESAICADLGRTGEADCEALEGA
ncbi:hypothetical protein NA644_07335 [Pseudomonas stutzeri]|uniref:hypothetical protein n=1 Tax=Stutzerimonas stutzeri TaxID=316 RepID=UPI00210C04F3|nr:hypothetical protein [Stutzerimonas stutzeri]MCQ4249121.1 hypothetical protein [Stutzerimonas stutzeri]